MLDGTGEEIIAVCFSQRTESTVKVWPLFPGMEDTDISGKHGVEAIGKSREGDGVFQVKMSDHFLGMDTGDWGRGWSMISPGQSGHPANKNYDDQIGLWQNVRYRPMVFGREMAELAAKHRLILTPGAPT